MPLTFTSRGRPSMSVRRSLVLAASLTLLIAAIMIGCSKSKNTSTGPNPAAKELDSPNLTGDAAGGGTAAGSQYVHKFSTAGTFHYHCTIHAPMVSQINVVAGG